MNKFFYFLVILLFIPFGSSEVQTLGTFKTGECIILKQTCTNCSYVNFSLSVPPNQNIVLSNQNMSQSASNLWIYNFCNTSANGEYIYDTFGNPNGNLNIGSANFYVNPIGKVLTNAQAILYFLIFVIAFIFFFICILFGIYVPSGNKRDELTGYILAISNLKYVKIFMLAIAYLLLMLMFYFGYIISYGYLDLDFLGNLFYFTFYFMVVLILPLFIVGIYIIIANMVRDQKISDMLSRGLRIR